MMTKNGTFSLRGRGAQLADKTRVVSYSFSRAKTHSGFTCNKPLLGHIDVWNKPEINFTTKIVKRTNV